MTTFVLPVIEIENTINRLQSELDDISSGGATSQTKNSDGTSGVHDTKQVDTKSLAKQITNWKTVLTNYRLHNDKYNGAFNSASIQFNNIVNSLNAFKENKGNGELRMDQAEGIVNVLKPRGF